jgi:hypothetical protein
MGKFETICEMDIAEILKHLIGAPEPQPIQSPEQPSDDIIIQPDSDVGMFGKGAASHENNICIKELECGGILVKSPDLNIKLSKEIFGAIKQYIGDNNG